jgi:uncharacterized membrane protein
MALSAADALVPDTRAPRARRIGLSRPLTWLRRGAADLQRVPHISLRIGAAVALAGMVLTAAAWNATYLAPALLGGFLLVAPFLALPMYALSRQLERQHAADADQAWRAWRGNAESIALFGLVLALAYIFWERVAAIVFALLYRGEALYLSRLPADLLSGPFAGLLLGFLVAGAVLAAAVFAFSVVTAPLLLDRPVDVITAALTSLRCCLRNPLPMIVWAVLIAALTLVGFATVMVGLVVIFPWLAHASWHAYRDLVAA